MDLKKQESSILETSSDQIICDVFNDDSILNYLQRNQEVKKRRYNAFNIKYSSRWYYKAWGVIPLIIIIGVATTILFIVNQLVVDRNIQDIIDVVLPWSGAAFIIYLFSSRYRFIRKWKFSVFKKIRHFSKYDHVILDNFYYNLILTTLVTLDSLRDENNKTKIDILIRWFDNISTIINQLLKGIYESAMPDKIVSEIELLIQEVHTQEQKIYRLSSKRKITADEAQEAVIILEYLSKKINESYDYSRHLKDQILKIFNETFKTRHKIYTSNKNYLFNAYIKHDDFKKFKKKFDVFESILFSESVETKKAKMVTAVLSYLHGIKRQIAKILIKRYNKDENFSNYCSEEKVLSKLIDKYLADPKSTKPLQEAVEYIWMLWFRGELDDEIMLDFLPKSFMKYKKFIYGPIKEASCVNCSKIVSAEEQFYTLLYLKIDVNKMRCVNCHYKKKR